MIIISIILILIAGITNAIMDLSSEDLFLNPWMNKSQSYTNKYKYKPKWLFKTALVFVTDGWHLFQMISNTTLIVGVYLYQYNNIIIDLITIKLLYTCMFELIYSNYKQFLLHRRAS